MRLLYIVESPDPPQ